MEYDIRGVSVEFPHQAYECQRVYMEKVIQSVQERKNALLESPTGTGKTLCLLCATLAWRQQWEAEKRENALQMAEDAVDVPSINSHFTLAGKGSGQPMVVSGGGGQPLVIQEKSPRIIYTSRTHSQLTQVIKELRSTSYKPKTAILGSRKQLCIHPDVSAASNRDHKCRSYVSAKKCDYHINLEDFKNSEEMREASHEMVADIEEMVRVGQSNSVCPYYLSREMQYNADIIFAPYNYLIDAKIRRSLGLDLRGAVLIFDEAHNLESVCEDSASFDIRVSELKVMLREVERCIEIVSRSSYTGESNRDDLTRFKGILFNLINVINNIKIAGEGITRSGDFIYEILGQVEITPQTAEPITQLLDRALADLSEAGEGGMSLKVLSLKTLNDSLKVLFKDGAAKSDEFSKYFKVHIQDSKPAQQQRGSFKMQSRQTDRIVSCWCFNPGLALGEVIAQGVRNIILTSGTLSPLDSFAYELRVPFPIRLENSHVIKPSQIWVGVINNGPSGYSLNSSYQSRGKDDYKQALGNSLVNFARIVPNGLLVFFPSYSALISCIESWKQPAGEGKGAGGTIWERICRYKQPVIEPRESFQFKLAMEDFYYKVNTETGAVFFAVCRGKVSEGLDFADKNGRAVVVTGLPFPSLNDPKVQLKRLFLDQIRNSNNASLSLPGGEWYRQQASRAVNQAVGRVIRHAGDYGAIILADQRFGELRNQSTLSLWLRPHCKVFSGFGERMRTYQAALGLTRFFKAQQLLPPAPPATVHNAAQSAPDTTTTTTSTSPKMNKSLSRGFVAPRKIDGSTTKQDTSPVNRVPAPNVNTVNTSPQNAQVEMRGITRKREGERERAPPAKRASNPGITQDVAHAYIKKVKEVLGREEYKTFQTLLRDFRAKHIGLSDLMLRVKNLFNTTARFALLQEFIHFIPQKHQPTYLSMVQSLSADETQRSACRPQMGMQPITTTPPKDVPSEPPVSSLSPNERKVYKRDIATAGPSSPPTAVGGDANITKTSSTPVKKTDYDLITGTHRKVSKKPRLSVEMPANTSLPQHEKEEEEKEKEEEEEEKEQPTDTGLDDDVTICPICQNRASTPFESRCKHVCCFSCWKRWLDQKLECPVCRERVRLKQLTKLYFCP